MQFPALRWPASPTRRRPPDLVFAANEQPPAGALLALGVQHAATTLAFIAYVLVAASIADIDRLATQSVVSMTLLGMACCTALQSWGGRLGSGMLLVHMPNPFLIGFAAILLMTHGPGGLVGMSVIYGCVSLLMAPLVRHLRPLFPPPVVGAVICMGGMALVSTSVQQALGVGDGQWRPDGGSALISGITLGGIVVLSIWGRRLRLLALLLAIAAGVLVAFLLGQLEGAHALQGVPVLALPSVSTPVLALDPGLIVGVALVTVLSQLDTLGSVTMMDKMEDADWKRADMQAISGGIRANGLGDLVAGLFGSFPTATNSANIALVHATRSTARSVGLVTAVLVAMVAFLPQLTMALTLTPKPVLGAVGLYAAGFLIVSGMELATSRALDSRAIFAVGLSLCAGLAVLQMPQLAEYVPASLQLLLGNGFVVAGLLVVTLNLVFRIGTGRRAERVLLPGSDTLHTDITGFVEAQGAIWGARRAVVQRAAMAALEAAEAVANAGEGRLPLALRGYFDEFNLDLELLHSGPPLTLSPDAAPASASLMEGDDDSAIDAALAQMSGRLLRHLADRVSSGTSGDRSMVKLHFEH